MKAPIQPLGVDIAGELQIAQAFHSDTDWQAIAGLSLGRVSPYPAGTFGKGTTCLSSDLQHFARLAVDHPHQPLDGAGK